MDLKLWVPAALGAVIAFAYAFFYLLSSIDASGASSFGVANSVGLAFVVFAILAAGLILRRRAIPPQ